VHFLSPPNDLFSDSLHAKPAILKSLHSAKNCVSGPDCSRAFELSLGLQASKFLWVYSLKMSFLGLEPKDSAPYRPDLLTQGSCS